MIDELKPCPFCGYDAEHIHVFAGEEIVRCGNEGCPVRSGVARPDMQEAFALWNQRPTPSDKQEAVVYVRVPVEPTEKMIDAGCDCEPVTRWNSNGEILRERYKAMLKAAPLTQSAEQDFESVWEKARVMDETTKTMARFIWNSARQSAEQDRIDAERWRAIKSMWTFIDTEVVDEWIAKGASK